MNHLHLHHHPPHDLHVILAYKNFAAHKNISHIGLGVAAINTAKVLRREGIQTTVVPVVSAADLCSYLLRTPGVDHVIISAPWIPTLELAKLAQEYPEVQFAVNCHSNVGFLQADRNGVKLIREIIELEQATHNVHLAGNAERFCRWVESAFGKPCAYQPNLYYIDAHAGHPIHPHPIGHSGPLRIGIFGATRPLKNLMTAAAAALEISRALRVPLELWLSGGRAEGGGESVLGAISEMLCGLPNVTVKSNKWQSWPQFRQTVGHMHLLLQPSYTESFNMVTADGIAEGVPSVVSGAIDWAPAHWQADVDSASDVARVGRHLLHDPHAAREGLEALTHYVQNGVAAYRKYFSHVRHDV
jgi:hypothetical protein